MSAVIQTEIHGRAGLIRIYRPAALSALNDAAMDGIAAAVDAFAADSEPEVKISILPGVGGSERLPRALGKAKAMDPCLTGRFMDAREAEAAGLHTLLTRGWPS